MSETFTDISLELADGIYAVLGSVLSVDGLAIPVYITMPKNAPDNYVYIGGITQAEDGTKDEFIYTGTIQLRITTDNLHTSEKKLARDILKAVRGLLKPTVNAVFDLTDLTLVCFTPESYSELTTQTDTDLIRIDLIDIYTFYIQ